MSDQPPSSAVPEAQPDRAILNLKLLHGAYYGASGEIVRALRDGAEVNYANPQTGLSALHIAVGASDLPLCRYLIEEHSAAFFPDRFGRWPSLIAAECQVDDALSDYIVEQEARYLEQSRSK